MIKAFINVYSSYLISSFLYWASRFLYFFFKNNLLKAQSRSDSCVENWVHLVLMWKHVEWSFDWILLMNVYIWFVVIHVSLFHTEYTHSSREETTLSVGTHYSNAACFDIVSIPIESNNDPNDEVFFCEVRKQNNIDCRSSMC